MKKVWFPPLFAAFPVISLFSANVNIVPFVDVAFPLLVVLLGCGVCWLLGSRLLKSALSGAVVATLVIVGGLEYGNVIESFTEDWLAWWVPALYLVFLIGIGLSAIRWLKSPEIPNLLGLSAVVVASISATLAVVEGHQGVGSLRHTHSKPLKPALEELPDVFYVIVDGYGRADALKRALGFDNQPFIRELLARGFYVASQSRSNYCQTELSVSSSLNMDYLQNMMPPGHEGEQERAAFQALVAKNSIQEKMTELGYVTVGVTSGFPSIQFPNSELVVRAPAPGASLFASALLQQSIFHASDQANRSQFELRRNSLLGALSSLESLAEPAPKPRFVIAHILAPHPPFVVTEAGEPMRPPGPFGYFDGSDYMSHSGTGLTYAAGYKAQAEYVNRRLLAIINVIKSRSERPPIIIIQGDHGSKRYLDQNSLARTDLKECFPNLNAYFVPKEMEERLYPSVTPVNSFRILLDYLSNADLPLLPDKCYFSPYAKPQTYSDVTATSQL